MWNFAIIDTDAKEEEAKEEGWGPHQGKLAQAQEGYEEAEVDEPYFPDLDDAAEANQASLAGWGQTNHALLRPEVLEGALGRAANYWYYENSIPKAAAALAHGVGQAQAFEDGNKRTAYWLTHHFLHENDHGHIAHDDDEELADHLVGYAEGTHTMDDTAAMFESRAGQTPTVQAHTSNILDPIHSELPGSLWDKPESAEPKLKSQHQKWITSNVKHILEKAGYTHMDEWLSLVLTGSLTTYQYSDDSDVDISVFVDAEVFPEWSRAEMIGVMVDQMDGIILPGTGYPMQCFVVPSDITREDLYKPGLRSGYDIETDKWIEPPDPTRTHDVEKEMNASYVFALESADKMERLLRYEPDTAIQYWHQIHKRRRREQKAGKGDFSQANIVYKFLAQRELFPKISEISGEYIAHTAGKVVEFPEGYEPYEEWEPGDYGKGLFIPKQDRLVLWKVEEVYDPSDENYYHHYEMLHALGLGMHDAVLLTAIYPDGTFDCPEKSRREEILDLDSRLSPVAKSGWTFGSATVEPRVIEHPEEHSRHYYPGRRPMVYNPVDNILHVGIDGGWHSGVMGSMIEKGYRLAGEGEDFQGWLGANPEEDPENDSVKELNGTDYGWYGEEDPGPHVERALVKHFNAKPEAPGWTFGKRSADINHQQVLDANRGQNLQGLPGPVNVPNLGPLQFHSNDHIQKMAQDYNRQNGIQSEHPSDYLKVNPQHGAKIAEAYEQMEHKPHDPQVKASYDALASETKAQYDHAVKNGYQFEFYPEHDPYPNSPREAVLDLHHNKHMYVYPTESGYGPGEEEYPDHPMLADSGVEWGGRKVTINDKFRAIHDMYGHAKEGLGFRSHGEDNAYRQHAAMFTPLARKAMAAETRGQNSYVNFGPNGEHNQTAKQEDTIFAPQKAGLLPDWAEDPHLHRTVNEGKLGREDRVHHYFHSTSAKLQPGDLVISATDRNVPANFPSATRYDPTMVYMWDARTSGDPAYAWGENQYEVQPLSDVVPDPERELAREDGADDLAAASWVTSQARVIRLLDDDQWGHLTTDMAYGDYHLPRYTAALDALAHRTVKTAAMDVQQSKARPEQFQTLGLGNRIPILFRPAGKRFYDMAGGEDLIGEDQMNIGVFGQTHQELENELGEFDLRGIGAYRGEIDENELRWFGRDARPPRGHEEAFATLKQYFPDLTYPSNEWRFGSWNPHQSKKQVAKFAYDPIENHLVLGHMAAEEGEVESHYDLANKANISLQNGPLFGQISQNGYIETFVRLKGYKKGPMNQYEADFRLKKALEYVAPGAKSTGIEGPINPKWQQEFTEPRITNLGDGALKFDGSGPNEQTEWNFS